MSTVTHPQTCFPSLGSEDDWKDLYEASFPQDERMPVAEVRTMLANGSILLHKTTDATGALQSFSLVTPLSNFLLLAYIATDQTKRSSGVGSKHMKALIALLKKAHPSHLGLFLEIESTKEANLSAAEDQARKRRLAFYQRLQCSQMSGKDYLLPSYTPGTAARQGELLWFEFSAPTGDDATLKAVIAEIYTRGYNVTVNDPAYVKVIGQFGSVPVSASVLTPVSSPISTPVTAAPAPAVAPVPASVPVPATQATLPAKLSTSEGSKS